MDGVCSCFDLTEVNVVFAPRRANRQPFHKLSLLLKRICNSLQNCEIVLLYSSPSLYPTAYLQWKIYPDILGDILKIFLEVSCFIYVWKQIAKYGILTNLCLSLCLSVCLSVRQLLCPTESTCLPTRVFMENNFQSVLKKVLQWIKSDKQDGYFTGNVRTFVIIYD